MIDRLKHHGKLYLDGWLRVARVITPRRVGYVLFLGLAFTALMSPWLLGFGLGWMIAPQIGLSNMDGGVAGTVAVTIFGWLPYCYGSMGQENR